MAQLLRKPSAFGLGLGRLRSPLSTVQYSSWCMPCDVQLQVDLGRRKWEHSGGKLFNTGILPSSGFVVGSMAFHTTTVVLDSAPSAPSAPMSPGVTVESQQQVSPRDQLQRLRKHCQEINDAAVKSVLPDNMVKEALTLIPRPSGAEDITDKLMVQDKEYKLSNNVHIIAFGKAVTGMVKAAEEILGKHIVGGIASVPKGIQHTLKEIGKSDLLPNSDSRVQIMEGAKNNYPDDDAWKSAMKIHDLVQSLGERDIALVLISGGGSALLPAPIPPISLDELGQLTKLMSLHGATINEMNIIRKHVELLKGGGLAKVASPAKVISLILSDVIGNELGSIASGPTSADYSSAPQCLDILEKLNIKDKVPQSVTNLLQQKTKDYDLQKNTDSTPQLTTGPRPSHDCGNAHNVLVGSNKKIATTAWEEADALGYIPYVLSTSLDGEAREIGSTFAKLADFICRSMGNKAGRDVTHLMQDEIALIQLGISKDIVNDIRNLADDAVNRVKPICIIGSGETTVTVKGKGVGGRNQELALAAAIQMNKTMYNDPVIMKNFQVQFLSFGTDGQDGPCDAAGAMSDPGLLSRAQEQGLDVEEYLDNNDTFNFFAALEDGKHHLISGLTGTNVMDLQLLLIQPHLWTSYHD